VGEVVGEVVVGGGGAPRRITRSKCRLTFEQTAVQLTSASHLINLLLFKSERCILISKDCLIKNAKSNRELGSVPAGE
jgi:hypothetical protein